MMAFLKPPIMIREIVDMIENIIYLMENYIFKKTEKHLGQIVDMIDLGLLRMKKNIDFYINI